MTIAIIEQPTQAAIGEIVLWAEEWQGEIKREWPAIIHAVNEDGTVNLTAFTDFGGGPTPDHRVSRAPDDQPAPGCWRPIIEE